MAGEGPSGREHAGQGSRASTAPAPHRLYRAVQDAESEQQREQPGCAAHEPFHLARRERICDRAG